jgi:phosphopantothenoylcysteine decarboxylase/phosphopantothenate--cysteine ligase
VAVSGRKMKKSSEPMELRLKPTEDILSYVASLANGPFCVGFAAESEKLLEHAREKLLRKKLPLIVGNLGPATFGRDDNSLLLVDADAARPLPADGSVADKLSLARQLVAEIARRLPASPVSNDPAPAR